MRKNSLVTSFWQKKNSWSQKYVYTITDNGKKELKKQILTLRYVINVLTVS